MRAPFEAGTGKRSIRDLAFRALVRRTTILPRVRVRRTLFSWKSHPRIVRGLNIGGFGFFVTDIMLIIDLASQTDSHCRSDSLRCSRCRVVVSFRLDSNHLIQPNQSSVERQLQNKDFHHDTTVPPSRNLGFLQWVTIWPTVVFLRSRVSGINDPLYSRSGESLGLGFFLVHISPQKAFQLVTVLASRFSVGVYSKLIACFWGKEEPVDPSKSSVLKDPGHSWKRRRC